MNRYLSKNHRLFAILTVIAATVISDALLSAADPISPALLSQTVQKLEVSKADAERSPDFLSRVRKATWQLLAGEMAGEPSFSLSSRSYDELKSGLEDLDHLIAELDESPKLQTELSQNLQLAMRFDATRSRRSTTDEQLKMSRSEELERLSQLREINRAYRELIGSLMRTQTSLVTGQADQVASFNASTDKLLSDVEQIVARRRDFYLFQDEPELTAPPTEELKLVKQLAQPLAQDVRRHQMALQAFTLIQLASSAPDKSRQQLLTAKKLAEAAIIDSAEPPFLGNWALALASRELGRLETTPDPWDNEKQRRAQVLFELAQKHLTTALQGISEGPEQPIWKIEIQAQLDELVSPEFELEKANKLLASGQALQAVKVLEHCASLHRSHLVAMALIDAHRFAGDSLEELDELANRIFASGLMSDKDPVARFARGRQGVLGIWQVTMSDENKQPKTDRTQALASRLSAALSDLKFAAESDDKVIRRLSDVYMALGSVIEFSIEPSASTEMAKSQLLTMPALIAELNLLLNNAKKLERINVAEATITGQLAYGLLALRFLPDYRDIGPKSFAAATDLRSTFPAELQFPQPLGSAMLNAMILREDASNARLARDEQFVRKSLQRVFPAIAAMQFAPDEATAAILRATARRLEGSSDHLSSKLEVDPRESLEAGANAGHEIRTAMILAFLQAHKPADALREALVVARSELETADLKQLNVNDIRSALQPETDPVRKSVAALALEEFAASDEISSLNGSREILRLALELQQAAKMQFDESAVLRATHPSQIEMNQQAIRRLSDPGFYLEQSRQLSKEFRLSEARKLLDAGIRRHPESIVLKETFVQTLIDEADLRPEVSKELTETAIAQLESLTANSNRDVYESFLKLAELYERIASADKARSVYRQVADQSTNERQRLLARSRLTALQIRTTKR